MQLPLEIVFRDFPPSPAVEAKIRQRAEKLDQLYPRIMSCRVVVESHHKHKHNGILYHVRIDLTVPGAELVASREPHDNHAHEDVYVAIRDAFDAMRRQLEAHARRQRGEVKTHDTPPHGRIVEINSDFGRIETPDGRLVYFHRNSVIETGFEQLGIGDRVHFSETTGDLGPQASTVHVEGKHHVAG